MGIKYTCDRCGRDIESHERYEKARKRFVKIQHAPDQIMYESDLCDDCYDLVIDVLADHENSQFRRPVEDDIKKGKKGWKK